jgi:CBS domain-containing protein
VTAAAQSILDRGGWCVCEVCVDVPAQLWEPRALICHRDSEAIADAIETEIAEEPGLDARITGCDRTTLRVEPALGAHLCYLADIESAAPALAGRPAYLDGPESEPEAATPAPCSMPGRGAGEPAADVRVATWMNRVVVTVAPDHTLREAARRMTARGVGAAVAIGADLPPRLLTERDILRSSGLGQDIDSERVRDHAATKLVYAPAHWPVGRAAEMMIRCDRRHVIVLGGFEAIGILSMRDIVRCLTADPAGGPIAVDLTTGGE